jgi:hypothetical protein
MDILPNGDFLYITTGADPLQGAPSPTPGTAAAGGTAQAPASSAPPAAAGSRLIAFVNWLGATERSVVPR